MISILRKSTLLLPMLLLSGCSLPANPVTGTGSIKELIHTASGYVIEASKQAAATIELGKIGIQKGKETVNDLTEREEKVKKGIETVQAGKQLIEDGLNK